MNDVTDYPIRLPKSFFIAMAKQRSVVTHRVVDVLLSLPWINGEQGWFGSIRQVHEEYCALGGVSIRRELIASALHDLVTAKLFEVTSDAKGTTIKLGDEYRLLDTNRGDTPNGGPGGYPVGGQVDTHRETRRVPTGGRVRRDPSPQRVPTPGTTQEQRGAIDPSGYPPGGVSGYPPGTQTGYPPGGASDDHEYPDLKQPSIGRGDAGARARDIGHGDRFFEDDDPGEPPTCSEEEAEGSDFEDEHDFERRSRPSERGPSPSRRLGRGGYDDEEEDDPEECSPSEPPRRTRDGRRRPGPSPVPRLLMPGEFATREESDAYVKKQLKQTEIWRREREAPRQPPPPEYSYEAVFGKHATTPRPT